MTSEEVLKKFIFDLSTRYKFDGSNTITFKFPNPDHYTKKNKSKIIMRIYNMIKTTSLIKEGNSIANMDIVLNAIEKSRSWEFPYLIFFKSMDSSILRINFSDYYEHELRPSRLAYVNDFPDYFLDYLTFKIEKKKIYRDKND